MRSPLHLTNRRHLLTALLAGPAACGLLLHAPAMASGAPEKKKGGGTSFIQISPITAYVLKGTGGRGVISVELGIDVVDEKLREKAALSVPRLRSAYLQSLQAYATSLAPGRAPNLEFLVMAFQRQTDLVIGKPGAKFLIGSVMVS